LIATIPAVLGHTGFFTHSHIQFWVDCSESIRITVSQRLWMQAFHTLYHTDDNVLLGAPTGSGKTISAELTMMRLFRHHPDMKVIYIAPLKVRLLALGLCLISGPS
jgi:replicative superfamily II helicase